MIYESIKMVFKVFKTNKLRTFLTMLGIIIGIFSITIIFSISAATKQSMKEAFEGFDNSLINVCIYGTYFDEESIIAFPESELSRFNEYDCIEKVYRKKNYTYKELEKKREKKQNDDSLYYQPGPELSGIGYEMATDLKITEGRTFSRMDDINAMPFCILSEDAIEEIFDEKYENPKDVLGKEVIINEMNFSVIGFVEKGNSMYGDVPQIYVLNSCVEDYFESGNSGYSGGEFSFTVKPVSKERKDEAKEIVREIVLEYQNNNEFYIESGMDGLDAEIDAEMGIIELVFGGIAGLSLVVGGIGIMNIMLVSVNERIKEIGIRMALGANSGNIMLQFLIEGIMLTLLSGIIGMVLASGGMNIANMFLKDMEFAETNNFKLVLDISVMIKTVLFCGFIGILFGLYPAKKAANLNPIDALRYE